MQSSGRFLIVCLLLIFGLAPIVALGQSDAGTLHVSIRDKASGQVVPAIVCITSVADGTWRQPPDGLVQAPFLRNTDFMAGRLKSIEYIAGDKQKWFPGDPGPALVMNGTYKDQITRDQWYFGGPAIPFWKEPVAYFISQPFDITLPPGKWRLSVMRGFEYQPVYEEITIAAGKTVARDVQLVRWVDMASQGWYSGDPHVHSWRVAPLHDKYIITFAKAMDVHMTSTLAYCSMTSCEGAIQSQYGKAGQYHEGDYWVQSGIEDPREDIPEQGHVSQIDIQSPVHNPSQYQLFSQAFDEVHAQGGLVGYDHLAWSKTFYNRLDPKNAVLHPYPGWDVNINTIRGKVDFFSILQNNSLGLEDYYDFLNLGVKLVATASTDYPSPLVGEEVTYAYTGTGGNFSPEAWYEAVKRGRTFVTNGPMLTLTIGDAMPGDEVKVGKGAKLHVHAQAWAPESIGAPKVLEIVAEGRVIQSVVSHGPQQDKLVADFDLPAGESQWVAARTTSFNGAVAHTTPVYVIVDNKSFIDRKNVQQLVAKQLKVLDWIEKDRLANPQFTSRWNPDTVKAVWKDVEYARARYLSLASAPDRPAITGIADVAFRVSNLEAARNYYGHVLGYREFSVSPGQAEDAPETFYFKVNDRQYIEIVPGLKNQNEDRLIHIGFETEDASRMRDYLASRGVAVPAKVTTDECGNLSFTVKDPDGHAVEFVQYMPDSIQLRNAGNFMPGMITLDPIVEPLSDHILHLGIHVADPAKADGFYKDLLGFRPLWVGGPQANPKEWISALVPDGSDWLEYITAADTSPQRLAAMNHVALEVTDIHNPYQTVLARGYAPPARPQVARDGRWIENLYDPDGTRTELMIRKPADEPCCTELHDPFIMR
jgi:catechol 2,3-dioxygenase-like lactoylglutathione lyase family enzyme